jgi:membrane-associated phospholipid phosphatase
LDGWLVPVVLAGLSLVIIGGGYELIAQISAWRGRTVWDPSTRLDFLIPFVPWSVVAYMTVYFYFPLAYGALPRTDRGRYELLLLHQGLFLLAGASFAVFLASPCRIVVLEQLPPALWSYQGMPAVLYGIVHGLDTPYNAWPSLHVSISLLIALHINWRMRTRALAILMWLAWLLLAISVLTTKQHFVFDVVTGALLAAVYWRWALRPGLEAVREQDHRIVPAG